MVHPAPPLRGGAPTAQKFSRAISIGLQLFGRVLQYLSDWLTSQASSTLLCPRRWKLWAFVGDMPSIEALSSWFCACDVWRGPVAIFVRRPDRHLPGLTTLRIRSGRGHTVVTWLFSYSSHLLRECNISSAPISSVRGSSVQLGL